MIGKRDCLEASGRNHPGRRSPPADIVRDPRVAEDTSRSGSASAVSEVLIRKEGDALIIVPARKTWRSYADEAPAVGDDFMVERPELMDDDGRVVL